MGIGPALFKGRDKKFLRRPPAGHRRKVLPHGASRTLHDQAHLRAQSAKLLELGLITQPYDLNQAVQRVPLILARTQAQLRW